MEKYSLPEIEKIISEQKYKFCSLFDKDGQTIVPFNRPQDKKDNASKRFQVIKQRMKALPDGVYQVACRTAFNTRIKADLYPLIKGNGSLAELSSRTPAPTINLDPNKVLTYTEALEINRKAMEWEAKYNAEKLKCDNLQQQYNALKIEYDSIPEEDDTLKEDENKSLFSWLDKTAPTFLPIVDRYMGLKERQQELEEFRAVNRLDRSGGLRNRLKQPSKNGKQIPKPGTEEWEAYLDKLADVEDSIFQNEMLYLHQNNPAAYKIAYEELVENEEGEESEEEGKE